MAHGKVLASVMALFIGYCAFHMTFLLKIAKALEPRGIKRPPIKRKLDLLGGVVAYER